MDTIIFILKSLLIGIVEGVTEFLPISSTGHMIIVQGFIDFKSSNPDYVDMYTYVIQLGAILAVVILYWTKIKDTFLNFFPQKITYEKSGFKFWFMIFISCLPGLIAVLLFDDLAEKYLFNPISVSITLVLGGIAMIFAENKFRNNTLIDTKDLNVTSKQAIIIGSFQCLSIIPGMSRSASTIIGGWVSGLPTVAAAEYSFFLAIPVMIGMSALKLFKFGGFGELTSEEILALIVGFVVSFVVALIVINKFISYLKKKPMKIFAQYRIIFGVIILLFGLFGFFK